MRRTNRLISLVILTSFLIEQASFAADLKPRAVDVFQSRKIDVGFKFPESIAAVEDSYQAQLPPQPSSFMIYLIQDAHTNESGQINLSKTLDILFSEDGRRRAEDRIKYVFVEAGVGDDSLSFLRKRASLEKRKQVAAEYLKKGILHGEEYLDLTSNHDFVIWGVEDFTLYQKAIDAYRAVVKDRRKFQSYLSRIQSTLDTLKPRIFNPGLLSFDEKYSKYLKEETPLTDYFQVLAQEAQKTNISLLGYPYLLALDRLKEKESGIDFKTANEEQQKAMQSLPAEDQKELLEYAKKEAPFKLGSQDRKEDKAFYTLLESVIARSAEGATKQSDTLYPNLFKYFSYLKEAKTLNPKKILEEQKQLETEIFSVLAKTPDEQALLHCQKKLRALRKLFDLKLIPEEYAEYKEDSRDFTIRHLTGFLNKKIMDFQNFYDRAVFLEEGYDDIVKNSETFYELTKDRDEAFLKTLSKKMTQEKQTKAILITGGFHATNLKALFKDKNISFVSITPQVYRETNQKRYESLLLNQKISQTPLLPGSMVHAARFVAMSNNLADAPVFYGRFTGETQSNASQFQGSRLAKTKAIKNNEKQTWLNRLGAIKSDTKQWKLTPKDKKMILEILEHYNIKNFNKKDFEYFRTAYSYTYKIIPGLAYLISKFTPQSYSERNISRANTIIDKFSQPSVIGEMASLVLYPAIYLSLDYNYDGHISAHKDYARLSEIGSTLSDEYDGLTDLLRFNLKSNPEIAIFWSRSFKKYLGEVIKHLGEVILFFEGHSTPGHGPQRNRHLKELKIYQKEAQQLLAGLNKSSLKKTGARMATEGNDTSFTSIVNKATTFTLFVSANRLGFFESMLQSSEVALVEKVRSALEALAKRKRASESEKEFGKLLLDEVNDRDVSLEDIQKALEYIKILNDPKNLEKCVDNATFRFEDPDKNKPPVLTLGDKPRERSVILHYNLHPGRHKTLRNPTDLQYFPASSQEEDMIYFKAGRKEDPAQIAFPDGRTYKVINTYPLGNNIVLLEGEATDKGYSPQYISVKLEGLVLADAFENMVLEARDYSTLVYSHRRLVLKEMPDPSLFGLMKQLRPALLLFLRAEDFSTRHNAGMRLYAQMQGKDGVTQENIQKALIYLLLLYADQETMKAFCLENLTWRVVEKVLHTSYFDGREGVARLVGSPTFSMEPLGVSSVRVFFDFQHEARTPTFIDLSDVAALQFVPGSSPDEDAIYYVTAGEESPAEFMFSNGDIYEVTSYKRAPGNNGFFVKGKAINGWVQPPTAEITIKEFRPTGARLSASLAEGGEFHRTRAALSSEFRLGDVQSATNTATNPLGSRLAAKRRGEETLAGLKRKISVVLSAKDRAHRLSRPQEELLIRAAKARQISPEARMEIQAVLTSFREGVLPEFSAVKHNKILEQVKQVLKNPPESNSFKSELAKRRMITEIKIYHPDFNIKARIDEKSFASMVFSNFVLRYFQSQLDFIAAENSFDASPEQTVTRGKKVISTDASTQAFFNDISKTILGQTAVLAILYDENNLRYFEVVKSSDGRSGVAVEIASDSIYKSNKTYLSAHVLDPKNRAGEYWSSVRGNLVLNSLKEKGLSPTLEAIAFVNFIAQAKNISETVKAQKFFVNLTEHYKSFDDRTDLMMLDFEIMASSLGKDSILILSGLEELPNDEIKEYILKRMASTDLSEVIYTFENKPQDTRVPVTVHAGEYELDIQGDLKTKTLHFSLDRGANSVGAWGRAMNLSNQTTTVLVNAELVKETGDLETDEDLYIATFQKHHNIFRNFFGNDFKAKDYALYVRGLAYNAFYAIKPIVWNSLTGARLVAQFISQSA